MQSPALKRKRRNLHACAALQTTTEAKVTLITYLLLNCFESAEEGEGTTELEMADDAVYVDGLSFVLVHFSLSSVHRFHSTLSNNVILDTHATNSNIMARRPRLYKNTRA